MFVDAHFPTVTLRQVLQTTETHENELALAIGTSFVVSTRGSLTSVQGRAEASDADWCGTTTSAYSWTNCRQTRKERH